MTNKHAWLTTKLNTLGLEKADTEEGSLMLAAAETIERLAGEVEHAKSGWQALIDAPDRTPEQVAESFIEYERTNQTLATMEPHARHFLIARLASMIGRARVDGGLSRNKDINAIADRLGELYQLIGRLDLNMSAERVLLDEVLSITQAIEDVSGRKEDERH